MRKSILLLSMICLTLSACGDGDALQQKNAAEPPPLYENPPFGASDIDATVEEARSRMQSTESNGNSSIATSPVENSSTN